MDAVRGSSGAIGAEAQEYEFVGEKAGLNEIRRPMNAGIIRDGSAQCKRTTQKADVWNTSNGG